MNINTQYMLDTNPLLKRYLREHSYYYKNIIRNPEYIKEILEMMKKDYHITFPDRLSKVKDSISMINTFMDVLK